MMSATTLFSAPISHHHPYTQSNKRWPSVITPSKSSLRASSSTPTLEEENGKQINSSSESIPIGGGGCKACGKAEIESGCNGDGRIQGGIATFPGFGWWPIKAYRPCPALVATGGRYRRKGQSMDEVAGFGGVSRKPAAATTTGAATTTAADTKVQSSEGPRKFKR